MNTKKLIEVLEAAVAAAPPAESPKVLMNMWMYDAESGSRRAVHEAVDLLAALKAEPELKVFDGKTLQVLSISASTIEFWHLGAWLILRTRSVGARGALRNLARYLRASVIPVEVAVVFSGLQPESACKIGRNISLLPWSDLKNSAQKQAVHAHFVMQLPFNVPTAALVRQHPSQKSYVSQSDYQKNIDKYHARAGLDATELHDCLMCLALVGPSAPQVLASWISVPDWVPIISTSFSLPALEGFSVTRKLSAVESRQGRRLFANFGSLTNVLQARLRLVMQRLLRAMRRGQPVDAAIDLGISLEALYLSDMGDDPGELSFRLRTRCARLLGNSQLEREEIFRVMGQIYGLRSKAVHTGIVPPVFKGKSTQDLLDKGFDVTARTVRGFIAKGEPNWEQITFG
jgi:hypothetical protein